MSDQAIKRPSIPSATGVTDWESLRRFLAPVKTLLDIHEGSLGRPGKDRFVPEWELGKYAKSSDLDLPTILSNDATGPAPPTNFVVTAGSYVNILSWVNPVDEDLDAIQIWVNTSNSVTEAVLVATVTVPRSQRGLAMQWTHYPENLFTDHYYWIRSIDYSGNYSTWVPPTSQGGYLVEGKDTVGQTIAEAMRILNKYQPLAPVYDPEAVYHSGDIVRYPGVNDGLFQCYFDNSGAGVTGVAPPLAVGDPGATYWMVVGILVQGYVDGLPCVGINGNLMVDGSILARSIATDTLIAGGNVSIANGAISIAMLGSDTSTWMSAVEDAVSAAQFDANEAQSDANSALLQLTAIASDSKLSPVEKSTVISDYNVITAEKSGIDARATAYGITTEKTSYDNAISALTTYLGTLTSPYAWNSFSGDTTIVGATFRSKFSDVYAARQTLLNKIVEVVTGQSTAKDIINMPNTPTSTAGFYNNGSYMGFHNGTDWKAYFQNNGNFYFGGDANNYFQWDGSIQTLSTDKYLKIMHGGDLRFYTTSASGPSLMSWYTGTDTLNYSMGMDYANSRLCIFPATNATGGFHVGVNQSGSQRRFNQMTFRVSEWMGIYSDGYISFGGVDSDYLMFYTPYIRPNDTNVTDIGTDAYKFRHLKLSGDISCVDVSCDDISCGDLTPSGTVADFTMDATGRITASSYLTLVGGTTEYQFASGEFSPEVHIGINNGHYLLAWDNCYADDFVDRADFYFMDAWQNPKTGEVEALDDLAAIHAIKPRGQYDPVSGLMLIDDDTIPVHLLAKHKKDDTRIDDAGKKVVRAKAGDVISGPDGAPYLSLKTMISLLMGAARQLDGKIDAIHQILTDHHLLSAN